MRSLALALLFLLCGCGPIGATSVIADAEVAVSRAHAADGDKYAIYETTAADLYLQKAREEQGAAQYANAIDLARKSVALADSGARKAAEAKKVPVAPPMPSDGAARTLPPGKEPIPLEPPPPSPLAPEKK